MGSIWRGAHTVTRWTSTFGFLSRLSRAQRRIALIAGPKGNFDAEERMRGYRAASYSIVKSSLWALDTLVELGFDREIS